MHPLQLLAAFHEDGRASDDLIIHLIGNDCLDLARFLVRDLKDLALERWLNRRMRERDADWRASGKVVVSNRHIKKARRAADWVRFRADCHVLNEPDVRRLWRDVHRALAVAPPDERLSIAAHFYQTCDTVSCELLAEILRWDTDEVRLRFGLNHCAI